MPTPEITSGPRAPLRRVARDPTLRRRLIARDERALGELIDAASPWLLAVVQAMLSDRDEAEDVVMEVYAVVWNRVHETSDDYQGLMPWLLRIARNRAIDRLRRRKRTRLRLERLARTRELGLAAAPPAEPDEAGAPGWHVHEAVHGALGDLPAEQLACVQLAYFQGRTHSEIASELGIPMGTVKTRLRLAYDKLRIALAPIKDWVL